MHKTIRGVVLWLLLIYLILFFALGIDTFNKCRAQGYDSGWVYVWLDRYCSLQVEAE
jgi:hypothetical protein